MFRERKGEVERGREREREIMASVYTPARTGPATRHVLTGNQNCNLLVYRTTQDTPTKWATWLGLILIIFKLKPKVNLNYYANTKIKINDTNRKRLNILKFFFSSRNMKHMWQLLNGKKKTTWALRRITRVRMRLEITNLSWHSFSWFCDFQQHLILQAKKSKPDLLNWEKGRIFSDVTCKKKKYKAMKIWEK